MAVQTLTLANQTGIFVTSQNAFGTIAAVGTTGPQVRINTAFALSSSGEYAGIEQFRGVFSEQIKFPGTQLKFWLTNPLNITNVQISVVEG